MAIADPKSPTSLRLQNSMVWWIRVVPRSPSRTAYEITATVHTAASPSPIPTRIRRKWGVVIGLSAYTYINGLSFCDEDAAAWCEYLVGRHYSVRLLGDGVSTYGHYGPNDTATEANVRRHIRELAELAAPGDQFACIVSGHGGGDGAGNSFLCCLDARDQTGVYTDKELLSDIKDLTSRGVTVLLCFDTCMSGGMLDEFAGNPSVCATATCTAAGSGYDMSSFQHGAWTYAFLCQTLMMDRRLSTMEQAFRLALARYPFTGVDRPAMAGNSVLFF